MRKKVGFILYFCARMSILSLRTYAFHHVLSWKTSDYHHLHQDFSQESYYSLCNPFLHLASMLARDNDCIDQDSCESAEEDDLLAGDGDGAAGDKEYVAYEEEPLNKDPESVVPAKRIQNLPAFLTAIYEIQLSDEVVWAPNVRHKSTKPLLYPTGQSTDIPQPPALTITLLPPTPT